MGNSSFHKNLTYAFLAQGVLFISSSITNLVLPKVLGVEAYSYWQLFVFYANFVPLLALGLNDGIYLRYGGKNIEEMNYSSLMNQFFIGLTYQICLCILVTMVCIICIHDINRIWIIFHIGIYFVCFTVHNYWGYYFQAVNQTSTYSKSILIGTSVYILLQIIALYMGVINYHFYVIIYTCIYVLGAVFLYFRIKKYIKGITWRGVTYSNDLFITMRLGISLMLSNVCSMLVLGISRQIVDMKWGLLFFAKVSFSLTLINFFLSFMGQISLVLFPNLRRLSEEDVNVAFDKLYYIAPMIIAFLYVLYYPMQHILCLWLPEYNESIHWLGILMPLCYFECKMNLLGNTFLKVFMKQDVLLRINIITVCLSLCVGIIAAYIIESLEWLIWGMIISVALRSLLANIYLGKLLGYNIWKLELMDIVLAILFVTIKGYGLIAVGGGVLLFCGSRMLIYSKNRI